MKKPFNPSLRGARYERRGNPPQLCKQNSNDKAPQSRWRLPRAIALAMTGLLLTGCTSERLIYRPVTVPTGLTQMVQKPLKPNPKTATQQDVGVFLIEQNAAIDACNEQLNLIKNWSKQHEENHQRTLRKPD